jgi:hypothetical protein
MEHLSPYGSSVRGTWRRGSSNGISKGRLWRWASLYIGAPSGNPEGGSFTRDFDR